MKNLTNKISNILIYIILPFVLAGISGCSSDSVESGKELLSCTLPMIPDAAGKSCVAPPPLECELPLVPNEANNACIAGVDPNAPIPSVFPADDEAILYYNRANKGATNLPDDPSYDGYTLHTWNTDACNAYSAPYDESNWGVTHVFDGIDPNYGAYWIIPLIDGYSSCGNYIIHVGTDGAGKETDDNKMKLDQDDPDFTRMNFFISGQTDAFEFPITSLGPQPLNIEDAAAHWIDAATLVWDIDTAVINEVRLHHSATAGIEADLDDNLNGIAIVLSEVEQTEAQQAAYPATANWATFSIDATAAEIKAILKNELVLASYDADGAVAATHVQAAKVLDDLYTSGESDADEVTLGILYESDAITARLWAPTAQNVKLNIYDASKTLTSSEQMVEDSATGIWSFSGATSLDRQFFRYELTVFHHQNNTIETIETTDPYSVSLSTNGFYSQFVNLNDADLKPDGWDGHTVPTIADVEDAVIYEGHIRDFSVRDESTSPANRGKYMAFTETGSAPVQHLTDLAASGLTHFHMLPANDIASINEDEDRIVDLEDTVAALCAVNADAPVCGIESDNDTLLSVMQSYAPSSEDAQALTSSMSGYDSFNWGYDPKHFNVPDGIYASDTDGVARIIEMRAMNMALHETGLRVVLDVVYNHTNSAGLWENSVFDKIVPGYYHRRDLVTGNVTQDTCCNDTELAHRMMDKFVTDSLVQWTSQYGFDGFRFDIMSHGSKAQMLAARDAVQALDSDNYFYGEGWYRGDGREATQANQDNMAGTEIATFNDRLRDGVRGAALFNDDSSDDSMRAQDIVKLGMAGTLANYVLESSKGTVSSGSSYSPSAYALDPADVINYVSKHDDNTLWDQLQFNLPFTMSMEDRVRSQNIAAAIPLMSQGIPFFQFGGDMLRSKSMDRNSYDAGDWFNYVDFTMGSNNWNVGLPLANDNSTRWYTVPDSEDLSISALASSPLTYTGMSDVMFASNVFKEFLSIRSGSKLFRLTTEADVLTRVGFHNIGKRQSQGVIVMSIDDGIGLNDLDPANDALVVVVNGTAEEQSHTISTAAGFELHATLAASIDARVSSASFSEGDGEGTFIVPAKTMAVFVKPQGAEQGEGLSAYATSGAPDVVPYGDTTVYLRGDMNGWGEVDGFNYKGDGLYQVTVDLVAETTYNFKVASADWSSVNYGALSEGAEQIAEEGVDKTLAQTNFNLSFTPTLDGAYIFEVDATNPTSPILKVKNDEPFVGTTVYVRGTINGWSTSTPMTHIGGGIYTALVDIADAGEQEFKIASEDWSTVDYGSAEEDASVAEGVEELLAVSGTNMTMDFTVAGEYSFVFNASDLAEPNFAVYTTKMFGDTQVFIRGGMNGWGTDDELVYLGNSIYASDIELAVGSYEFKIASEDWSSVDFGANAGEETVTVDTEKTLAAIGANMTLEITTAGVYRFELSGPSSETPRLKVTAQ